jgi:uncharacterized lipoprotein YajG
MNSAFSRYAVLVAALSFLPGCALKTQYLHVDPQVKIEDSAIGSGVNVGLSVSDKRDTKKVGDVGDPELRQVEVLLVEDPTPALFASVKKALQKLGFNVLPAGEAGDRTLSVELRKLELNSVRHPFNYETELKSEMAMRVVNANSRYDRQVNVRTHMTSGSPPLQGETNELTNTAITQSLEDLLADDQLRATLAK